MQQVGGGGGSIPQEPLVMLGIASILQYFRGIPLHLPLKRTIILKLSYTNGINKNSRLSNAMYG